MEFIETSVFRRRFRELFGPPDHAVEEAYRGLQNVLVHNGEVGAVITGTGGLRKVRFAPEGRGKSGGVRVIYYWAGSYDTVLMALVFSKNEQADLTSEQRKDLKRLVREFERELKARRERAERRP